MYQPDLIRKFHENPSIKDCKGVVNYLNQISGKSFSIGTIRRSIFKQSWKEQELNLLNRSNCKAAAIYLQHLCNASYFLDKQFKIVLADLLPIIAILDKNQETDFILISTNTLPSFIHYKNSQTLFYDLQFAEKEQRSNYHFDILTIFSLRLTLESRIHGLLGIDTIHLNGKAITLNDLLSIVKTMKSIEFDSRINWDELIMLNKWLNHYMHRHIRPYTWCIHQAFEILKPLLEPKVYSIGDKEIHSLYAATVLKNKQVFQKELVEKLELQRKKLDITWSNSHEVIIL